MTIRFSHDLCADLDMSAEKEWLETNGLGGFASSTITGMNTRRYHGLLVAAVRPPTGRVVMLSKLEEVLVAGGIGYELSCNRYRSGVVYPTGHELLDHFAIDPFPTFTYSVHYGDGRRVQVEKLVCMVHGENTTMVRYRLAGEICGADEFVLHVRPLVAFRDYHCLTRENDRINRRPIVSAAGRVVLQAYSDLPPLHLSHNAVVFEEAADWFRGFLYSKETERGMEDTEDLFCYGELSFRLAIGVDGVVVASTGPRSAGDAEELLAAESERRARVAGDGDLSHSQTSDVDGLIVSSMQMRPADGAEHLLAAESGATRTITIAGRRYPLLAKDATSAFAPSGTGDAGLSSALALEPNLTGLAQLPSGVPALLSLAADGFVVERPLDPRRGLSVVAGYHWFGDWGRDTMISLPGLCLVTGRFDQARQILATFARWESQGMLPNRFPDSGEKPDYNTVDASLWFFHAVDRFLRYTGDSAFVDGEILPALRRIVDWYHRGTRFGIGVDDSDGLLAAGEDGTQLTWMDVKVEEWVVTPRCGKAVEVNALWHNALRVMARISPGDGADYRRMADRVRESFGEKFWNEEKSCLYDVVEEGWKDESVRPNQIFAVSLPYRLLPQDREKAVLGAVERDLLTPYGLRSLAPGEPGYVGCYAGDRRRRDGAYHQGTVWAWLIGPFVTAYMRVHGRNEETARRAREILGPLLLHLCEDAGLGSVSEIFDGDSPHTPRGCIAQAWSVAELLRAFVEEAQGRRPPDDDCTQCLSGHDG